MSGSLYSETPILMTCCGNRYATIAETVDHECPVTGLLSENVDIMCEWYSSTWYLLCTNSATAARPHPILGQVPICDRCNAKVDRISAL